MTKRLIIIACLLAISVTANAFDSKRKGLVFGLAALGSPLGSTSEIIEGQSQDLAGWGMSAFAGWGIDNRNVICLKRVFLGHIMDMQGRHATFRWFTMVSWLRASKPEAKSMFWEVGAGHLMVRHAFVGGKKHGPAVQAGIGYQFFPAVSSNLTALAGFTKFDDRTIHHLMLTVGVQLTLN